MVQYRGFCVERRGKKTVQYKVKNGAVSYGSDLVLEQVDIEINDKDKIAIVGRNGCGKTTLLKAIMGEVEWEEGTGEGEFRVIRAGNPSVCYLRQTPFSDESLPMEEEVLRVFQPLLDLEGEMARLVEKMEQETDEQAIRTYSRIQEDYLRKGGTTYRKEWDTMIQKFGFTAEERKKPLSAFSGGQRTKIAFMKMLLSKPDVLLLDEPTNHLDVETVEWLESYLKGYPSTLVIVSHDRMFLERIVDKVYEIEWGETHCYKGNYSDFERQKRERHEKQQKDYDLQQAEIQRLNRLIERFRYKATKAKMVQSKIKQLEHMERISAPDRYDNKTYETRFQPDRPSSRQVLEIKDLAVGYGAPLATVNLRLERGQKLGIIGGNGIGKSTFLKTLMGVIPPLSGSYQFGHHTDIAYFDQQLADIHGEETVLDHFSSAFPHLTDAQARSALGSFQFRGDEVFQKACSLSGGEKVRLTLCKLLYQRPNVLLLDEPTNHMDIVGKEALEEILSRFEGTVVLVSHDRYFVQKIADRLLIFDSCGVEFFDDTYDAYERRRGERTVEAEPSAETEKKPKGQKYVSPKRERDKQERRLQKVEDAMEETREHADSLRAQMEQPEVCSDYEQVTALQQALEEAQARLLEMEEEWLLIQEWLEEHPFT